MFRTDVVVKTHVPSNTASWTSDGRRRGAGDCLFATPNAMRDSTEFFVVNGYRTNDAFNNDCLEWTFSGSPGSYSVEVEAPFFDGEVWNPGYLAMQTESVDRAG
jgi:hypothetical protein